MRLVKLNVEVTLAGGTVEPGEIIALSDLSAQALVDEHRAVFVEEN